MCKIPIWDCPDLTVNASWRDRGDKSRIEMAKCNRGHRERIWSAAQKSCGGAQAAAGGGQDHKAGRSAKISSSIMDRLRSTRGMP